MCVVGACVGSCKVVNTLEKPDQEHGGAGTHKHRAQPSFLVLLVHFVFNSTAEKPKTL